jgi:Tfp pilus assembly protein PilF
LLSASELQKAVAFLEAGDWEAAHAIVQQDEASPAACWAHAIVHLMEGDVANARYWYRAAGRDFPEGAGVADEISALKSSIGIGRAKK